MSDAVRINIFRSYEEVVKRNGKVILVGPSLEDTLQGAGTKLGEKVVELQTIRGATIDEISLLRDWDTVIAVIKDSPQSSGLSSPQLVDMATAPDSAHASSTSSTPDFTLREKDRKWVEPTEFSLRRTSTFPASDAPSRHDWVRLNVGGRIFATTRATLSSDPTSMLARMFEPGWSSVTDSSGAYLIDRSPEYFEPLLNFLRHSKLILNEGINPQGVLEEAKFFGISKAIDPLETIVRSEELSLSGHFTRREFLKVLSTTSSSATLRCQGAHLEGVDLSNLDLRHINFKCANLRQCNLSGCDLSHCIFERADMYQANLDGAIVQCVHMPRVNMEGATFKGCTMDTMMGIHTNLEGANLKGAMFDNSQMNGVNLRLASLKGASLRSCNLRYAIMAGTDLENSDLLGSDLQHANLRGANIKGTNLQDVVI